MDRTVQALDRAKANSNDSLSREIEASGASKSELAPAGLHEGTSNIASVSIAHLQRMRIFAHDLAHPGTKAFDLLRTQVLRSMDANNWRVVGVTSPTSGCGKTLTAINLTLSAARQRGNRPLLIDLDLQKPDVANRLGVSCAEGMRSLLTGETTLQRAITPLSAGGIRFDIVACEQALSGASDWTATHQLSSAMQHYRSDKNFNVVVVDMPPLLTGDTAITLLPHLDCVMLIAAAGKTRSSQIKECARHLGSTPVVRLVLNKAPKSSDLLLER